MNKPKQYESSATIYIGTSLTPEISQNRVTDNASRYAFDNLLNVVKSRETLKEVGLRLLALHVMLDKADPKIISAEHFQYVQQQIPADIKALRSGTTEETYQKIKAIADTNPFLVAQINYPAPYYSNAALSGTSVLRITNSEMVKMSYVCDDQGICQNTLEILIDVSIRNYRRINESQTDSAVAYFEKELDKAKEQLKKSEEKELQFKKANDLINYQAQTDITITQRDDVSRQINKEREGIISLEAGIRNIEQQLGSQAQTLKNKSILDKRELLGRLSNQLSMAELNNTSSERVASLQLQINQVKEELNKDILEGSSGASVSGDVAASEYFSKVVSYEESKARLRVLENNKTQALMEYDRFLPLGDTLKRIEREIEINEKSYISALQSLNQSRMRQQDQQSMTKIQVIDKPNYPLVSKASDRKMMIAMGGMVGLVIPVMIILLIAYFDNNIKTPQRAEDATGLDLGGIFPNMKKLTTYKNSEQVSDSLSDTILKNLYLTDSQSKQQRILVISTRPSEGKTTISNLLCERLIQKGRKCLVVVPYLDSGSWSVVSYKVDNAFYQSKTEDIVPVQQLNETDVLIMELPSLIMNDYPVALIKQFNMAFLVCDANREWTKADQNALDSFIKISGLKPYLILNDVDNDVVEEVIGKVNQTGFSR